MANDDYPKMVPQTGTKPDDSPDFKTHYKTSNVGVEYAVSQSFGAEKGSGFKSAWMT